MLDEGAPEEFARLLRLKGHDVVQVAERPELRAAGDQFVLAAAVDEHRAVLTTDVADYLQLHQDRDRQDHYGLLFVPLERLATGAATGALVRELDELLSSRPDDVADSSLLWLGGDH